MHLIHATQAYKQSAESTNGEVAEILSRLASAIDQKSKEGKMEVTIAVPKQDFRPIIPQRVRDAAENMGYDASVLDAGQDWEVWVSWKEAKNG